MAEHRFYPQSRKTLKLIIQCSKESMIIFEVDLMEFYIVKLSPLFHFVLWKLVLGVKALNLWKIHFEGDIFPMCLFLHSFSFTFFQELTDWSPSCGNWNHFRSFIVFGHLHHHQLQTECTLYKQAFFHFIRFVNFHKFSAVIFLLWENCLYIQQTFQDFEQNCN